MSGFTLMSLVCAVAPSAEVLIAGRVLQGLLGALMLPQGLGLIKEMFPPNEAGKAFGAFGPVMGLSAVAGPILAGWLVDLDLFGWSWRTIFAINVPLGVAALAAGMRVLPANRPDTSASVDVSSAALASAAMVLLIFPLIQGRELGWPVWTYAMLAAGVLLLVAFVHFERVKDRAGRPTLVTPSLFTKRAFFGGLATGMGLFGALMGLTIVYTLFFQLGLGYDPLHAGLAGIPQALGMVVGFIASQPLMAKVGGRQVMFTGELLAILGLVGFGLTITAAGDGVGILTMSPALAVTGVGMGLTMAPFFDIVIAGVDERESGSASGALTSVQQLAGAFGVAVLGTLFFHLVDGADAASRIGAFREAAAPAAYVAAGFLVVAAALTTLLPRRAWPEHTGH